MNSNGALCFLRQNKNIILNFKLSFPRCGYAKKEGGSISMVGGALKKKKISKVGPATEKKVLPVETDPEKLVKFVCGSNIYKTGTDVETKPDSEYPEWLWNLRLGPPPRLEELDPNTLEYWKIVRTMGLRRNNKLNKLKKFQ